MAVGGIEARLGPMSAMVRPAPASASLDRIGPGFVSVTVNPAAAVWVGRDCIPPGPVSVTVNPAVAASTAGRARMAAGPVSVTANPAVAESAVVAAGPVSVTASSEAGCATASAGVDRAATRLPPTKNLVKAGRAIHRLRLRVHRQRVRAPSRATEPTRAR